MNEKNKVPFILIGVIAIIFTISVISILVAKGYNFKGTNIVEQGILNINSTPDGAIVYVSDEKIGNTPIKIDLAVNSYELRIEKDGYTSWSKTVNIKPSIVTDISAKLIPSELNLEQLTFLSIHKAFFTNDGENTIFTTKENGELILWKTKIEKSLFEISNFSPEKIADLTSIIDICADTYTISISDDNQGAILNCSNNFYYLSLVSANTELRHLNSEIKTNPTGMRFAFTNNDFFLWDNFMLAYYNLSDPKVIFLTNISGEKLWSLTEFGDEFLLLDKNQNSEENTLNKISRNLTNEEIVINPAININEVIAINSSLNQDYIILITQTSSFLYNMKNNEILFTLSSNPIQSINWSPDGTMLLYQDLTSIKSCKILRNPDSSYTVETYLVLENFDPAAAFFKWSPNSLKIGYFITDKLYLIDPDGANKTLIYEGDLKENSSFSLSKNAVFVIFLKNDDSDLSNLYSVKLVI